MPNDDKPSDPKGRHTECPEGRASKKKRDRHDGSNVATNTEADAEAADQQTSGSMVSDRLFERAATLGN